MPRIAWVSSSPTPYRLPFFEKLSQSNRADFHFFFCGSTSRLRPWQVKSLDGLPATVLRGWNIPLPRQGASIRLNPGIFPRLMSGHWDLVVIAGYYHLTMQSALFASILRRLPFILMGETHQLEHRTRLVKSLKKSCLFPFLRCARATLATGTLARRYWQSVGIPDDRIFICSNTPDIRYTP